jgi:hypothetical protein
MYVVIDHHVPERLVLGFGFARCTWLVHGPQGRDESDSHSRSLRAFLMSFCFEKRKLYKSIKYQVHVERALVKKPIGKLMNVAFKGETHGKFALLHEAHNLIRPFTRWHN